jgi:DEAD/DEAH box helicase domain-containing protein
VDETIAWLHDRPYYDEQIQLHRTIAGRRGETRELPLQPPVAETLSEHGIDDLYAHQADAIAAVRRGQNAVLATPTASGKSLAYMVPALERAIETGATTLYIGPQVALINDQEATLTNLTDSLAADVTVAQYTGTLSNVDRRTVREDEPNIVLTTPDMLHCGILSNARLWEWFFDELELVVIDEIHEYRGVFGSHVGLVLRRLARLCETFDAAPQFVCCSATIGNPRAHAATITGQPKSSFTLIDEDTSATGPTHWLFWQPPTYAGTAPEQEGRRRSHHGETLRLFTDLVSKGYQTVVFTRARQAAERYAAESTNTLLDRGAADLADAVTAYHAGLRDDRRASIESDLHTGDCPGVWSTNALELGVDIGGLDAVLLDGYPGTRMASFQQAGRAGRGQEPSLVTLVASEDQLDQYVISHPDELFDGPPEHAVANPTNPQLLRIHARAAATEGGIRPADTDYFGSTFPNIVADLTDVGQLQRRSGATGLHWVRATSTAAPNPYQAGLRTVEDRAITLRVQGQTDRPIVGRLSFTAALRDVHPGAIYYHQGQTYEVATLDLARDVAWLTPTDAAYQTRVRYDESITIDRDVETKPLATRDDVTVRFAEVTRRKRITGFERRNPVSGEQLGDVPLDLPETTLQTRALYFTVPNRLETILTTMTGEFSGGIHAVEHALIATFPLSLLCDRRDIGGISTPQHPETDGSTIFLYDGYPGGVGLARSGYDQIEDVLRHTWELIAGCSCDSASGCPACVQSPYCGNANEPLNTRLALVLLTALVDSNRQIVE